jgi:hypothetical protein
MRNLLIALALVASGCVSAPDRGVVELAVGSGSLLSDKTLEGNVAMDTLTKTRAGVEWEIHSEPQGMALDFGLGVQAYADSGQPGTVTGVDATIKLSLAPEFKFTPYVIFSASYDKMSTIWEGTDVDYTFANSFGGGFSYELSETEEIFIDYRWWHTSNGSSFHTDSFRDTFGLEESQDNPGYEAGIVTVGYTWTF